VRELANEVQRALVLTEPGERIGAEALSDKLGGGEARPWRKQGQLKTAVESLERDLIQRAFDKHNGNKTHMAEELGVSRWTLLKKMRAYGIEE
jgi:transcriptional regulator with PAS, ATPase and Fis domain